MAELANDCLVSQLKHSRQDMMDLPTSTAPRPAHQSSSESHIMSEHLSDALETLQIGELPLQLQQESC
jgi:hypothetical protein